MKVCPFCQSKTRGVHHKACVEMRRLTHIDQQVGMMSRYPHAKAMLAAISKRKRIQ